MDYQRLLGSTGQKPTEIHHMNNLPGPTRTYMRHLKNSPHNDPKAEAPGAIRDAVYSEAGQEVRKR